MSFDLNALIAAPSQELFNLAKKIDLLGIAAHYEVKRSMLKHEIKNILIQFFVDERKFLIPLLCLIFLSLKQTCKCKNLKLRDKLRLEHEEKIRIEKSEREERIRLETTEREDRLQREKLEQEK